VGGGGYPRVKRANDQRARTRSKHGAQPLHRPRASHGVQAALRLRRRLWRAGEPRALLLRPGLPRPRVAGGPPCPHLPCPCRPACPAALPARLPIRAPLPAGRAQAQSALSRVLLQDTLAFIVRVYAVLLTAQAPLLYGIRQVTGRARAWAAHPHPHPTLLALALALTPAFTPLCGIRQIESAAGLRPFWLGLGFANPNPNPNPNPDPDPDPDPNQIESAAGLRPFCAVYALVFGGTAAVCWLGVGLGVGVRGRG
jgi:hypothetical protein